MIVGSWHGVAETRRSGLDKSHSGMDPGILWEPVSCICNTLEGPSRVLRPRLPSLKPDGTRVLKPNEGEVSGGVGVTWRGGG